MQEVEEDMGVRRSVLEGVCAREGHKLRVPLKLYNKRLRFAVSTEPLKTKQNKKVITILASQILNCKLV